MPSQTVAVLYARADSIYKTLPGCDVWDIERDARKWPGGAPVVAHPPCRAWGGLRAFARPRPDEKELAFHALAQVRRFGGVLEHPRASTFWAAAHLPLPPPTRDTFDGFSLVIDQFAWGHRAQKRTLLYIFGIDPLHVPPFQLRLGEAECVVASSLGTRGRRAEITKREREATPPAFAVWLCELARRCAQ